MTRRSLDDIAQLFDEVYTRMTQMQRRLIAATRSGVDDDPATRELSDEAAALIAAFDAAGRAIRPGMVPYAEMEARALRARVLVSPLDGHLLMAAARSQTRAQAFPLLADAIAMADGEPFWNDLTVLDVLSAPSHMGDSRARWLAEHLELDGAATIAELGGGDHQRLVDGLHEYAPHLPVEASGRPARPKFPDDGSGAGEDVLRRWVDALGAPTDPLRQAAWDAASRPGWSDDAVDVLEVLVAFTHRVVMPRIVPEFEKVLAADLPHQDLIAALRAEERAWRDAWHGADEEEGERYSMLSWVLGRDVIALQSAEKSRVQLDKPETERRGKTPLVLAREGVRRCAEILVWVDDDPVELLAALPGNSERQSSSSGSSSSEESSAR